MNQKIEADISNDEILFQMSYTSFETDDLQDKKA